MFTFISDNAIALGVLGTAIAGVINFWQFVKVRQAEQRQKEYENYHSLIDRLNIPQPKTGHPLLDMQRSAIFEMRYYPRYKELTHLILSEWILRSDKVAAIAKETLVELGTPYQARVCAWYGSH
jgi:hypothetical protein